MIKMLNGEFMMEMLALKQLKDEQMMLKQKHGSEECVALWNVNINILSSHGSIPIQGCPEPP